MVEHLRALYAGVAERVAVVVHPSAERPVREQVAGVDVFVQREPTGMLDAVLLAMPAVARDRPRRVLVTWCDQVGIDPRTVERLRQATSAPANPAMALLTCLRTDPYIHLERDGTGRIVRVLHRREGDAMPERGESDAGVFDLSYEAYADRLPEFARHVEPGAGTGERNFLPFIPWLSARAEVVAVPCTSAAETVGVNTPEELAMVEEYLKRRA